MRGTKIVFLAPNYGATYSLEMYRLVLRREVDEGDTGRCRGHLLGLPRIGSIDLDSPTKCQDLIGQFSSRRKVMANLGGRDP